MRVAIINYGMGNLGSVSRALGELNADVFIADQPDQLSGANRIILPGVGSFADGMVNLVEQNWVGAIRQAIHDGKPMLGICLGMQLFATRGFEGGEYAGLDLIPGEVKSLAQLGCGERIPHVGWNDISLVTQKNELFTGVQNGTDFYFVHSFVFQAAENRDVLAQVDYGVPFAAAIGRGHVYGTQFHPEKSSKAGFRLLKNFIEMTSC